MLSSRSTKLTRSTMCTRLVDKDNNVSEVDEVDEVDDVDEVDGFYVRLYLNFELGVVYSMETTTSILAS